MSNYINDRVFGSDIAFPIRKTLERRQKQTMNPDFGQSVSDSERTVDYNKNINFSKSDPAISIFIVITFNSNLSIIQI